MQNKSFIFWLFNKDKKAVYVDGIIINQAIGVLKSDGQPAHLEYSPDGWEGTLVKYGRNIKYLGLFRDFTAPMNFKKDGARIVKDAMWKLGMESILYLAISKLDRTVYPPKYDAWYTGELDFSKFDQKKSNVTLNVMEGGLSKYLKAFENTTYEIDVDADYQAERVVMDGFPFTNKIEYSIYDTQLFFRHPTYDLTYAIGMGTISQEGSTQGILNLDQNKEELTIDSRFMQSYDKTITISVTGTVNFHTFTYAGTPGPVHIFVRKINTDTNVTTDYTIVNEVKDSNNKDFSYPYSFSINLEPNDRLFLATTLTHNSTINPAFYKVTGASLFVNYEVTFKQTTIKALKPLRLLQKIVDKMTEGRFTAKSSFLGSMTDLLITSGTAIRNQQGSTIKTSLDEFFRSMKIKGVGLTIENDVLVIEKTKYFFADDVAIELEEVNNFEIVVAEDLVFNTIKTGYENQTYDNVNGQDEYNVTQNYTTPNTRIVKELDLTSPYRADPTGIELMRLNLDGKDTTDSSGDNSTFLLNTKKGGTYTYYSGHVDYNANGSKTITIPDVLDSMAMSKINIIGSVNNGAFTLLNVSYFIVGSTVLTVAETLNTGSENISITTSSLTLNFLNRSVYSSVTGLLHPSKMFNIELSPHRNLLNNGDYIHSVLDFEDSEFIKFQAGDKNSELSTTLNGLTITEKADIQIAGLPKKLFRPYYFTFKVPTDFNFLKTVADNPYSKISFLYNGDKYYGYLFDGGVVPATRDVQTIKLLCAPETNLLQLIDME